MLIDCHTHLDQYDDAELDGIVERARQAGVRAILAAGTTLESSARCVRLAQTYPEVYACVGVHPMDLREPFTQETYDRLKAQALSHPKVVAISEVGLDFLRGMPDRAWQYDAFRQQIWLARELRLPVIFHTREAHKETLQVLREEGAQEAGAIMHYFEGDEEAAKLCLELGFLISVGRPLTRSAPLREVVRRLPLESLVLETDCFPQPYKKRREDWTEPRHVREVAQTLAKVRGLTLGEVAQTTLANLKRVVPRLAAAPTP